MTLLRYRFFKVARFEKATIEMKWEGDNFGNKWQRLFIWLWFWNRGL